VNLYSYKHGGAPTRRASSDKEALIDFSVNISPISPPLPDVSLDSFALHRYPSIDGRGVRDFYCRRFDVAHDCVLPLNGAIEGIYLIPAALGLDSALVPAPSFYDYERACSTAGAKVRYLMLKDQEKFVFPGIEEISEKMKDVDAMFAANPNNPTGSRFPKEVVLALASRFPDKWFIIDEAFIQFVDDFPGASLMNELRAFKNIIVVSSLTKFYALPGLRLGAAIAHPDAIARLLRFKTPWSVNAVADAVALELLNAGDFEKEVRRLITHERAKIFKRMKQIPYVSIRGYAANFFLARWKCDSNLDELLTYLMENNIFVRDCRNFPGLEENYFRFAIRKPEENEYLLNHLQRFGALKETLAP